MQQRDPVVARGVGHDLSVLVEEARVVVDLLVDHIIVEGLAVGVV